MIIDIDVTIVDNIIGYASAFNGDKITGPYTLDNNIDNARSYIILKVLECISKYNRESNEIKIYFYHHKKDIFDENTKTIYSNDIMKIILDYNLNIKYINICIFDKSFNTEMSNRYNYVHNLAIISALKGKQITVGLKKKKNKNVLKINTGK